MESLNIAACNQMARGNWWKNASGKTKYQRGREGRLILHDTPVASPDLRLECQRGRRLRSGLQTNLVFLSIKAVRACLCLLAGSIDGSDYDHCSTISCRYALSVETPIVTESGSGGVWSGRSTSVQAKANSNNGQPAGVYR